MTTKDIAETVLFGLLVLGSLIIVYRATKKGN